MASVPKLNISQTKADKLAADLQKLSIAPVVKSDQGPSVPTFQHQGYLEKLGHSRRKWFKRFFVLRDSYLLSYNLQKSDFTVEPRSCVHLGNSKLQLLSHGEKEFCFYITTVENDQFLFAASSEEERQQWIKDLEIARTVTHANMVKLAVENQCLADERGVAEVAQNQSTSALALFSNREYIKNMPLTGGSEGWLRTVGFNADMSNTGGKSKKAALKNCYFMLRDSHLLMFQGGDILTKPRGVMYLVSTTTEKAEVDDGQFRFVCKSVECGDYIELVASSEKQRSRWLQALTIGSRVTYPDFRLLLKEHELLAAVAMTPRAAPPTAPNAPSDKISSPPPPLLAEDIDLQNRQLDPAAQQPYDENGNPVFRNPEGRLVQQDGQELGAKTSRFAASGQQLDPFNRPLPPGAVPMFTKDGQPIGVGPDGQQYLSDGTIVSTSEARYDANDNLLPEGTVQAANQIASDVSVAIKVRAMLKGDGAADEAVDMLGRTFRDSKDAKSADGMLTNADGVKVPMASARRIENTTGALVDYQPDKTDGTTFQLMINVDNEGDEHVIGEVTVHSFTTLSNVRALIRAEVETDFKDFVFLVNSVPMLSYEEGDMLAHACLPAITIRGKELNAPVKRPAFSKKVEQLVEADEKKNQERAEFDEIMSKVRQGAFLKQLRPTLLDP